IGIWCLAFVCSSVIRRLLVTFVLGLAFESGSPTYRQITPHSVLRGDLIWISTFQQNLAEIRILRRPTMSWHDGHSGFCSPAPPAPRANGIYIDFRRHRPNMVTSMNGLGAWASFCISLGNASALRTTICFIA